MKSDIQSYVLLTDVKMWWDIDRDAAVFSWRINTDIMMSLESRSEDAKLYWDLVKENRGDWRRRLKVEVIDLFKVFQVGEY